MAIETSVYPNTILEVLGIVIKEVLPDKITATMPVNNATLQLFGLLHGGASVYWQKVLPVWVRII